MLEVISGLPREELFSATGATARDRGRGARRRRRHAVRLFLRPDPFRRILSCLVYLPATSTRPRPGSRWRICCGGASAAPRWRTPRGSRSRGWRSCTSRCRARADAVGYAGVDVAGLQDELTEVVRTWEDRLLSWPGGGALAAQLAGVPEAYKAITPAARAVVDLPRCAGMSGARRIFAVRLPRAGGPADRAHAVPGRRPRDPDGRAPGLQQLGVDVLDERPSEFVRANGLRVDARLRAAARRRDPAARTAPRGRRRAGRAAFGAAWRGDVGATGSVTRLRTGLPGGRSAVLRASSLRRPARQRRRRCMAATLLAHPDVARSS